MMTTTRMAFRDGQMKNLMMRTHGPHKRRAHHKNEERDDEGSSQEDP